MEPALADSSLPVVAATVATLKLTPYSGGDQRADSWGSRMGCKGIGFGSCVAAKALAAVAEISALVTALLNAMDVVGVMAKVNDLVAKALA